MNERFIVLQLFLYTNLICFAGAYIKYVDFDNIQNRILLTCESSVYNPKEDGSLPSCTSRLRPVYETVELINSRESYTVQIPYKAFYKGLRAPEAMLKPEQWGTLIHPGARNGECMPSTMSLKSVKCWLGQSVFTWEMQGVPWKAGQPSRYSTGLPPTDPFYFAKGSSVDCLMTGNADQLGIQNPRNTNETCVMCVPDEGPIEYRSCRNGMVSDTPAISNNRGDGVVWGKVNCNIPCEVGTWMTCQHQSECMYTVPTTTQLGGITPLPPDVIVVTDVFPLKSLPSFTVMSAEYIANIHYTSVDFTRAASKYPNEKPCQTYFRISPSISGSSYAVSEDFTPVAMSPLEGRHSWMRSNGWPMNVPISMSDDLPLPLHSCYPCALADGRMHNGKVIITGDSDLVSQGFLKFYCPGGSSPPTYCAKNMVSKVDLATNRSGVCNCINGFYMLNGGCVPCAAGFQCRWIGNNPPSLEECPTDYYALEGWSACKQCTKNSGMCLKTQALTRCQRDGRGGGTWQKTDAFCVSCQDCQQVTGAVGARPCFKVIAVFNSSGGAL